MPKPLEKAKGALTHKVGPLPLWGWAVAGAAALFIALKMKGRGGSSSADAGSGILIPTLTPGSASSVDTGAFSAGSPGQNAQGGMDTQPGGEPPWWAVPPPWWNVTPSVVLNGPSTNGSKGTPAPTGVSNLTVAQAQAASTNFKGFIGTPATATAQINAARQNPAIAPTGGVSSDGKQLTPDTMNFFQRMAALGVTKPPASV